MVNDQLHALIPLPWQDKLHNPLSRSSLGSGADLEVLKKRKTSLNYREWESCSWVLSPFCINYTDYAISVRSTTTTKQEQEEQQEKQ